MKKIVVISGILGLYVFFLFTPLIALSANGTIGSLCNEDADCGNNLDCEDSNLDIEKDDFCVCRTANHCANAYSTTYGTQNWTCVDGTGSAGAYALHYCEGINSGPIFPVNRGGVNAGFIDHILDPAAALRASGSEIDQIIKAPQPRIRIPGVTFTKPEDVPLAQDDTGRIFLYVPFLGEYLAAIYRYAVVVASVIAVIMIIVSGFQWITSGGSSDSIQKAKERIIQACIGLTMAVGSYAVLYTINPNLVQFKSLRVQYIPTESISVEGYPESGSTVARNITTLPTDAKPANCAWSNFEKYAKDQETFGRENGYCLGWVKGAVNAACGGIPPSLNANGAWDVAAAYYQRGQNFHPCTLDGIKDGDIVFMTSLGSNWIGLWGNFRQGPNGCTIADALPQGEATRLLNGKIVSAPPVAGLPKGIPPVTHIGIYVGGKVYHLINNVAADPISEAKKLGANTRDQINWRNISLGGTFIHKNQAEFVAGYVSW